MPEPFEIDGSYGEGGGQILRTALSLSCITGKAVRIVNIRRNRPKPGLMPQHLVSVNALARISGAELRGAEPGSQETALGAIGKRAEEVGREAAREALAYIGSRGALDPHLADQLVPFIALSREPSAFTTTQMTNHLVTHLSLVQRMLGTRFEIEGTVREPRTVRINR